MKTLNKLFSIGALAFLLMLMAPHKSMAQDDGYVSDQEFYDELQQYGTWVQDDEFGDVWVPDVDGDFRPYATNGYWVQTDYGTTWVSDYPWGWATFHYGRWRYDDYYGWEWIPGHQWAPAWVSWRQGGGYYGWAPMGPGISISLSFGGGGRNVPDNYWVYTPQRYITSRYIARYYAPRAQVGVIIRNTTYIHNTYIYNNRTYITGPRPADIQKITRQRVTVYKINNASRPGAFHTDKNVINIYRPEVKKSPDARPVRVVAATAYKNEHPTEGIGKRGATGYNRGNAAKLAATIRADNPNSNVVKVNPRKPGANEPNKPNEPAINGHHSTPADNKAAEPKTNAPTAPATEPRAGNGHHKPAVTQPEQPTIQQPAANKPVEPQSNVPAAQPAPTTGGQGGHHHRSAPAVMPAHNANQAQQTPQQPAANKPVEPQNNAPAAQPAPTTGGQGGHHHRSAPAVVPVEQHNADQTQQQQQAKQEVQQQKQQQQQAQQAARQQAQQAARQQQQQAQQQTRQAAQQQQKQQQQQAQQAARQQAQQAARQAAQQKKQQEEQQKQQQQTPPGN